MDDLQYQEIKTYFDSKYQECLARKKAYDKWLGLLRPLRYLVIFFSAVLPLLTGSTILLDLGIINKNNWKTLCTGILFVSGIALAADKRFKLDALYEDALKTGKRYQALANRYQEAKTLGRDEIVPGKKALAEKLNDLEESTTMAPPQWCLQQKG
ncbi:hypothetical protein V9K67_06090 [Paraflavisolibacter sp. H34]|uniref:hypothetical protein n=1 Tax=Huijunlia imazamoxiresistens TaxID=3127457 RepID=UPI00301860FB